jgi:hypothetical protein
MDIVVQSHAAYWDQDPCDGKWLLIDKLDEIRGIYFTEVRPVCSMLGSCVCVCCPWLWRKILT